MEEQIIYHGSNVVANQPKVVVNGHYKDFGYGFYCTNIEKQAKRWALTRFGIMLRSLLQEIYREMHFGN